MKKQLLVVGVLIVVAVIAILFATNKNDSKDTKVKKDPIAEILAVKSEDYTKGAQNGKVTLVEYLDFECEACGAYYPLLKDLEKFFPNDLTIVARYFPLPGHKNGMPAALAVEAAARQGKFWEMHNLLFENQSEWGEQQVPNQAQFEKYATLIPGINIEQYKIDVASPEVKARVESSLKQALKLNIQGTPSFFLQGERVDNPQGLEPFKTLIEAEIVKAGSLARGKKVHEHADMKVFINNKQLDLAQSKYQSTKEKPLDEDTHLHDGNGEIVHKHRTGVTLGYFFNSIGITLDKNCLTLDTGKKYCPSGDKTLKMFVNGKENPLLGDYEFSDLDRILISYGDQAGVADQITGVKDIACMYSGVCPERGTPPTETCVAGLGDEC